MKNSLDLRVSCLCRRVDEESVGLQVRSKSRPLPALDIDTTRPIDTTITLHLGKFPAQECTSWTDSPIAGNEDCEDEQFTTEFRLQGPQDRDGKEEDPQVNENADDADAKVPVVYT